MILLKCVKLKNVQVFIFINRFSVLQVCYFEKCWIVVIFCIYFFYTVDCEWNPWVLGECSESCGKGTRIDTRTKNVTEAHGGECETVDTLDTITEDCNLQECPGNLMLL